MRARYLTGIAAALCCLSAAGCSTVSSADVRTSGINAHITAQVESGGVRIGASFDVGTFTSVELNGDDLSASTGSAQTSSFSESTVLGSHSYTAFMPGPAATGQQVAVHLKRGTGSVSTTSTVALPGPITITSPRAQATTRRSSDLLIVTNHGEGGISVAWSGSCVTSGSQDFTSDSAIVLPAGSIAGVGTKKCLVTFTVSRVAIGVVDSAFKGGTIRALRSATVVLWSAP